MAASTFTITNHDDSTYVQTRVGSTADGALYKDTSRALSLPRTLEFINKVGAPGSKGNDRLSFVFRNTVQNSTTGLFSTGSLKLEVSVPRDSSWTEAMTRDLYQGVVSILDDTAIESMADALVP
jgi:hypothetical protein